MYYVSYGAKLQITCVLTFVQCQGLTLDLDVCSESSQPLNYTHSMLFYFHLNFVAMFLRPLLLRKAFHRFLLIK